jgi:Fe-S-cluster containining protein
MSVPEVLRFERELSCLPTGQSRHVQAALLAAGRKLLAGSTQAGLATDQTSQWYESLGIVCPLACGGGCALYAGRPLACREHFATGRSAEPASAGCPGAEVLPLPVSVLEALADLSAQVQAMPLESIALPLALPWLEDNRSRLLRTWPAADLARTLVGILERQALRRLHAA